jgi:biopolymer transport protein ExbD
MPLIGNKDFRSSTKPGSFNMTPLIDIVFLLIIFFLVVCQFIEAENFAVAVPDGCLFAATASEPGAQGTTVTVMKTSGGRSAFAVGSEKIPASEGPDLTEQIGRLIDYSLRNLPSDRRIVTLRVDRDVCFAEAQYALAAIAQSSATDIQLAVLKNREPSNGKQ